MRWGVDGFVGLGFRRRGSRKRNVARKVLPFDQFGEASRRYEDALYLIASLYAHHPASRGVGNMGDHFARARNPAAGDTAIERRFTAVLRSHPDDFPFYLRQAVSYLKSKEIAVNWHQLLRDMLAWSHPDHYVQKRWARGFWGSAARPDIASEERWPCFSSRT